MGAHLWRVARQFGPSCVTGQGAASRVAGLVDQSGEIALPTAIPLQQARNPFANKKNTHLCSSPVCRLFETAHCN